LHVLSLPPAFVLSQDQTLKLKNLISTKSLRKLTEYLLTVGFPTAVYSPKRKIGRYSLDRPKGQSARTPPPTLLFLSSLVKEQIPSTPDKNRNPRYPPAFQQENPGPLTAATAVAAVDEPYLVQPAGPVNSPRTEIRSSCQGPRQQHLSSTKIRPSNPVHGNQ
jgi:hypothetical protein